MRGSTPKLVHLNLKLTDSRHDRLKQYAKERSRLDGVHWSLVRLINDYIDTLPPSPRGLPMKKPRVARTS
jgi:hypothetical protein